MGAGVVEPRRRSRQRRGSKPRTCPLHVVPRCQMVRYGGWPCKTALWNWECHAASGNPHMPLRLHPVTIGFVILLCGALAFVNLNAWTMARITGPRQSPTSGRGDLQAFGTVTEPRKDASLGFVQAITTIPISSRPCLTATSARLRGGPLTGCFGSPFNLLSLPPIYF